MKPIVFGIAAAGMLVGVSYAQTTTPNATTNPNTTNSPTAPAEVGHSRRRLNHADDEERWQNGDIW